jgi:hypothetical protein
MRLFVLLLLVSCAVLAQQVKMEYPHQEGLVVGPELDAEETVALTTDQAERIASAVKLHEGAVIPCPLCVSAVGFVQNVALHEGCGLLFSSAALAACEAIGLGPQDPLSELCTAALIGGCVTIANDLSSGIVNTTQICVDLTFC